MNSTILKATDIKKRYGTLEVLKGVDVEIKAGEIVSIVGASGAGKSTLLHILGTIDKPDVGQLWFQDVEITKLNNSKLNHFRNSSIGFVFQFHNLLPEFSAIENVMLPAWIGKSHTDDLQQKAEKLLHTLGLENRSHHKPNELSGGEQQRVAVARALINDPAIIFADEPSGNLDSKNAKELHKLFIKLRQDFNQTFIIVTHNDELAHLADRCLIMKDGLISA
jgi:lipoprotein-releasing system ATP-binding protein